MISGQETFSVEFQLNLISPNPDIKTYASPGLLIHNFQQLYTRTTFYNTPADWSLKQPAAHSFGLLLLSTSTFKDFPKAFLSAR
jgi:hypothetical protein